MKKSPELSKKTLTKKPGKVNKLSEPVVAYQLYRQPPQLKEFNYNEFKKIADAAPFTQTEWAAFLHLSERTLQRYAKGNSTFAAINAERAFQIEKVIGEGKTAFGSAEKFYNWLKQHPSMLEEDLSIESLTSLNGIEKILIQLGRIQQGLFA